MGSMRAPAGCSQPGDGLNLGLDQRCTASFRAGNPHLILPHSFARLPPPSHPSSRPCPDDRGRRLPLRHTAWRCSLGAPFTSSSFRASLPLSRSPAQLTKHLPRPTPCISKAQYPERPGHSSAGADTGRPGPVRWTRGVVAASGFLRRPAKCSASGAEGNGALCAAAGTVWCTTGVPVPGLLRRPATCSAGGGAEENGALCAAAATVADVVAEAAFSKDRKFVSHLEGGGKVLTTVSRSGSGSRSGDGSGADVEVVLEASLDSAHHDTSRPLLLHWGIHRSDCSSWFLLDPKEAPPGTSFIQEGETEAMRTPFAAPAGQVQMQAVQHAPQQELGQQPQQKRARGWEQQGEQVVVGSVTERQASEVECTQRLALKFSSSLVPFSLDFVLYQPPHGTTSPEQYIGSSSQCSSFSIPVGMDVGSPLPLGPTRLPDGSVNFALYSRHALGVVLCLYEALATDPTMEIDLEPSSHRTGDVWHVRILDTGNFTKYGFRCKGDSAWDEGHRFHTRTVLLDPYAKILAPPVAGQESLPSPALALGSIPPLDAPAFDWEEDFPLRIPKEELVVYRLNVGAFTSEESSGVPDLERGTFLGVARKAKYLRNLGVNAVLLQPVAAFDESQGSYFPFNLFAPMPAYGVEGDPALAARDMKLMVRELHKWGIEVLIEVVVSHTAEKSDQEPLAISFRGVDNKTYYITDQNGSQVVPSFGAPNLFNCNDPVVHTLILDALCHWVGEYHVDGFCFPNIQALLLGPHGQPVARPLLLEALSFEPLLGAAKLIADPCSPSTGACQAVQLPHWGRWMEVNPLFCSGVRRFLRGDPGQLSAMATRMTGSGDLFSSGRGPSFSLNYVTSFSGLTLADLVSYSVASEASWNCGVDGASEDPLISSTRMQQLLNFLAALFFSLGVPVLVMGDEYGSSKEGQLNLQDWDGVFLWENEETELAKQVKEFISVLAGIRRRHKALQRRDYWYTGDFTWHGVNAYQQPDWSNPNSSFIAYSVRILPVTAADSAGPALASAPGDSSAAAAAPSAPESALYVAFNAQQQDVQLELPQPPTQCSWWRVVDTGMPHPEEIAPLLLDSSLYDLRHHSVLVLEGRKVEATST